MNETNGKILWTADMVNEYGGKTITWGYNETTVVDGDIIYCIPGGKMHNVMALNRHDGSEVWSCPGKGELSAYCTPLLFTHNGRRILATHTESHLLGIDAKTGKLLWTQRQPNKYSVHANTPIYQDGEIFYFSGYGKGSGKLQLNSDGSEANLVWTNETMDSRMGGAVLVDGYIYGSGDQNRDWQCIDWKTGENTWNSGAIAKGNVIYADGKLYCYSERGELAMAKASPQGFNILSKTQVTAGTEQHWAHIMINNGILYLRHGDALVAYKIK
jgi:outer membrane protein assembly factor BamB